MTKNNPGGLNQSLPTQNITPIPDSLFKLYEKRKVSAGAFWVYHFLIKKSYSEKGKQLTQEYIAKKLGVSTRSAIRYIQQLEEAGFLKKYRPLNRNRTEYQLVA